jgi:tRNA pseudouridine synthase D (TruD)
MKRIRADKSNLYLSSALFPALFCFHFNRIQFFFESFYLNFLVCFDLSPIRFSSHLLYFLLFSSVLIFYSPFHISSFLHCTSLIRALTFQRVSSWRVDQEVLARVSADSMLVRDVCIAPAPLHLGDLSGNFFAITLRKEEGLNVQNSLSISAQLTASSVLSAFSSLAVYPFMNVFGAQRFGSPLPSNPEVGMRLLASDYRGTYVQMYFNMYNHARQ